MTIDIERIAREAGLIEPSDDWEGIPAEYREAVSKFAALVLEEAAKVCDERRRGPSSTGVM